jgi:hypothetical protein
VLGFVLVCRFFKVIEALEKMRIDNTCEKMVHIEKLGFWFKHGSVEPVRLFDGKPQSSVI